MDLKGKSEMQVGTPRIFQYIKLENEGRRHFCLQQSLFILAWVLFFKKNTLIPIGRPDSDKLSLRFVVRWLRKNIGLVRKNLIFLIIFARYKYQFRKIDSAIMLPFYGQLCAPVHQGHKIFDLRKGVAVKVFEPDVNTSIIANEIEQLRNVSKLDFASSIRRWSIEEGWYEEDYISGSLNFSYETLDSTYLLKQFYDALVQPLHSLILLEKPITKNAIEYINDTMEILAVSGLSRHESTVKEYNKIKCFFDSMVERFHIEGNYPVQLVFTHGDFSPANMLITSCGIRIVDWEGATFRSVLFDFYTYFFHRPVSRNVPVSQVVTEINRALPFFISSLAKKAPEISHDLLRLEKVYRWVYYIEQVCVELKRSMTYTQLNLIDYVLRYIDSFNLYEELIAGNVEKLSSNKVQT